MSEQASLIDFAINDRQREVLQLQQKGASYAEIGKELNLTVGQVHRALRTIRARASRMGYSPEHDMTHSVPEGFRLKGTSTLYDEDGNAKMQWVKTTADQDQLARFAEQITESLLETIKPIKPRKPSKTVKDPDRIVVYPLGDAHIGLYCWSGDAQEDWDSKVAETTMIEAFDAVLVGSPSTEKAVIVNLGDWIHTDTLANVTLASGHQLDVDTRWSKVIDLGFRLMRTLIDSALLKHQEVHVINENGNHDYHTAQMTSVALAALYEKEPRVTVDVSPDVFHWYEFGKNLFGVHHGHKVKHDKLYQVMCEDQAEAWGRCPHRTWLLGHVHHHSSIDKGTQKIESFRTIIPQDTYAHSNGYRSPRGQQAITYHREFGECSRVQYLVQSKGR
jgi:hypothetical protein